METKMIKVPFELELAKKITEKSVDGKIVTRDGRNTRIVCWNRKCDKYPIIALIDNVDRGEGFGFYTEYGVTEYCNYELDLMLEIPEYMTFKDGDVYKTEKGSVAIYNGNYQVIMNNTPYYVGLRESDGKLIFQSGDYGFGVIQKCTLDVTKEEKQELIEALKASKDPRAKEYLKRFFGIDYTFIVKKGNEFNPKDWVLTRDNFEDKWCLNIFSHSEWDEVEECCHYYCVGGWNYECIPYNEQTAHLLGTTENYE